MRPFIRKTTFFTSNFTSGCEESFPRRYWSKWLTSLTSHAPAGGGFRATRPSAPEGEFMDWLLVVAANAMSRSGLGPRSFDPAFVGCSYCGGAGHGLRNRSLLRRSRLGKGKGVRSGNGGVRISLQAAQDATGQNCCGCLKQNFRPVVETVCDLSAQRRDLSGRGMSGGRGPSRAARRVAAQRVEAIVGSRHGSWFLALVLQ